MKKKVEKLRDLSQSHCNILNLRVHGEFFYKYISNFIFVFFPWSNVQCFYVI